MGIRLRPKNPAKYQVGNAILYGGEHKIYVMPQDEVTEGQVFFVESDYGNHMTMSWSEISEMYVVVGWQDYRDWRAERDRLRERKPLNHKDLSFNDAAFMQELMSK